MSNHKSSKFVITHNKPYRHSSAYNCILNSTICIFSAYHYNKTNTNYEIHPPNKKGLRSFCSPNGEGINHEEKPFIKRNHDIVDACDVLIACPETNKEVQRSGTGATIRYARKQGKKIELIPFNEQPTLKTYVESLQSMEYLTAWE